MKVSEVFYSIQGESSFSGWPCAFVRLATCDLRCTYCDTEYAFYDGREMSLAQILDTVESYPTKLVLVTGGEPMLQAAVHHLFEALIVRGYIVCVETGGHVSLRDVDSRVHKIMDLKCPSSGMSERNHYENIEFLTGEDEVKFVIGDQADFDWSCSTIRRYDLTERVGNVISSPVHGVLPPERLARWVLDSGLRMRMQVQLHKVIWPSARRGR